MMMMIPQMKRRMKDGGSKKADRQSIIDPGGLFHCLLTTSLSLFTVPSFSPFANRSPVVVGQCSCMSSVKHFLPLHLPLFHSLPLHFPFFPVSLPPLFQKRTLDLVHFCVLVIGNCGSSGNSISSSICRLLNGGNIDYGNKTTARASRNTERHTHIHTNTQ